MDGDFLRTPPDCARQVTTMGRVMGAVRPGARFDRSSLLDVPVRKIPEGAPPGKVTSACAPANPEPVEEFVEVARRRREEVAV
jgi:hypothetical protein